MFQPLVLRDLLGQIMRPGYRQREQRLPRMEARGKVARECRTLRERDPMGTGPVRIRMEVIPVEASMAVAEPAEDSMAAELQAVVVTLEAVVVMPGVAALASTNRRPRITYAAPARS